MRSSSSGIYAAKVRTNLSLNPNPNASTNPYPILNPIALTLTGQAEHPHAKDGERRIPLASITAIALESEPRLEFSGAPRLRLGLN